MKKNTRLFTPIKIGSMEVKNRIAMPPMHSGFCKPDGYVSQKIIDYYGARAKGGCGLIMVEIATPSGARKYVPNTLGIYDDSFIPGFSDMAAEIHKHGAKFALQLVDPGPGGSTMLGGVPNVGPSKIPQRNMPELPLELSVDEIKEIVNDFAEAARRARDAGIDSVHIHAAHNYALLGSFLSTYYNKRSDEYGGSLFGRAKLLVDVVKAIKAKAGSDFPVIVRISGDDRIPGGRTIQETQILAPIIAEAGADALEISGGAVPEVFWAVVPPLGTPTAFNADFAAAIKQVVDIPVISVGRINSPHIAEFVLETGKADMVSMGRALIADPELPNKAEAGDFEDIAPCIGDNQGCLSNPFAKVPTTCFMNPSVGFEKNMDIVTAEKPKQVMVVGGGPAGLEVARVAALRGHEVTLFEKEGKLGGQINIASIPPGKQEISQSIKYLARQAEKAGVKVETGTEVTPDLIDKIKPQVVVVASGAQPLIPDNIPGVDKDNVCTAWDILSGKVIFDTMKPLKIVIIGGGSVGCETADFLAEMGENLMLNKKAVTIVEMMGKVALDMPLTVRHLLMERLVSKKVKILVKTKVKAITDDGLIVTRGGNEETIKNVDHIILSIGTKPVDDLLLKIKDKVETIHLIGDASKPRRALEAIAEGRQIGMTI
jgi:2,4-dienoyl-CoA reductase-like NADH-dependent reductase (Old Yellow Enzyme family)/thioredoxin reductase